jgi:hypothetical protein
VWSQTENYEAQNTNGANEIGVTTLVSVREHRSKQQWEISWVGSKYVNFHPIMMRNYETDNSKCIFNLHIYF